MLLTFVIFAAQSLGETVNNTSTAVATDLAKGMAGLGILSLTIVGLSLLWNVGGKQFGNKIRENLGQIFVGIAICLSASGIIAFVTASVGG